jgi:hypothetical protein
MTEIRPLDRSHNRTMLDILRLCPVQFGGVTLCFDRQPDIFAMADLKYDPPVWNGVFEHGQLMGFALTGYHQAHVNGEPRQVLHFTDTYFHPGARGRGYLFTHVPNFFDEGRASLGYAVRLNGSGAPADGPRKQIPLTRSGISSVFVSDLVVQNILLLPPRRRQSALQVRHARMDDVDDIVALLRDEHRQRLFGLVLTSDTFVARLRQRPGLSIENYYVVEHGGALTGVCAAWDTQAFKQDRVLSYSRWLRFVQRIGRVAQPAGFPALPNPGEPFRNVFLTDWAVRDRSPQMLRALIDHIYCEYRSRGYFNLVFGSCADDPLLNAMGGYWIDTLRFTTAVLTRDPRCLAGDGLHTHLPFIDVALL